jgi:hypothetical protein
MEQDSPDSLHNNPQYVLGQVEALRAVVLALARLTTDRDSLLEIGSTNIATLRAAVLSEPVADARIIGIDHFNEWFADILRRS